MKFAQLNAASFEQLIQYFDTVLVPIGSFQYHGPHAPFGTDLLIAERIVNDLEEQFSGRILALPPISYGHCMQMLSFAGTIDIPEAVLRDYVYYTLRPLQQWGIKNIVLVNGNDQNIPALNQAVELLATDGITVLINNWWLDNQQEISEATQGIAHGGMEETSVLLAMLPDLVNLSEEDSDELSSAEETNQKAFANLKDATAEKGEQIIKLVKQGIANQITSLWSLNQP